jgi:hypothetical protein
MVQGELDGTVSILADGALNVTYFWMVVSEHRRLLAVRSSAWFDTTATLKSREKRRRR